MKVLFAGHIGQPIGGITSYCEAILNSSLPKTTEFLFVETSKGELSFYQRGNLGLRNVANAFSNICRYIFQLSRFRPEVVHIVSAPGWSLYKHGVMVLAARALGSRVLLHLHFSLSKLWDSKSSWFHSFFVPFVLRACDKIIVLSSEWLAMKDKGFDQIVLIPNGINVQPFLQLTHPSRSEKTYVLYLGHIRKEKGIFDLIEAFSFITKTRDDADLHCFGEPDSDSTLNMIKDMITDRALKNNVYIHPPINGDTKYAAFDRADIFVLPSHHEGMPITVIEAMASGLPVVATSVGGIPDMLINYQTGLLVQPSAPKQLANSLLSLLVQPGLRKSIGDAGRESAIKLYTIEGHVEKLFALYNAATQETGKVN